MSNPLSHSAAFSYLTNRSIASRVVSVPTLQECKRGYGLTPVYPSAMLEQRRQQPNQVCQMVRPGTRPELGVVS